MRFGMPGTPTELNPTSQVTDCVYMVWYEAKPFLRRLLTYVVDLYFAATCCVIFSMFCYAIVRVCMK